jgi:arsenite methyltransferase
MMEIKDIVKKKYGQAALRVTIGGNSCCGAAATLDCCSVDPITSNLYDAIQTGQIPEEAVLASLGCGNPTALARENQRKAGIENAVFLKGEIESIPLPDSSVDVIISNCVINLSADKDKVLREAFRVLKPGGRWAVSDVVVRGDVPEQVRRSMEMWVGCIAGALKDSDYIRKLAAAGFDEIDIEPTRIDSIEDARQFLPGEGIDVDAIAPQVGNKFMSAFIRAVKPAPKECCGPACCS